MGQAKVFGGESSSVGLKSPTPVRMMVQRSGADKIIARIVYTGPVRAPIEAGQQIGMVKVWRGETVALEAPLFAEPSIAKGSMTQKAFDTAGEMMIGLLRAGAEKAFAKDNERRRKRNDHAPNAKRGRFITFEGGEGSGKSTQIKRLAETLDEQGVRTLVTREPGGSPGAEIVRHLVLSGVGKILGASGEALLFAAARDDHVHSVIAPALKQGQWVLCDRFTDSTRVYQGKLGSADINLIRAHGARDDRRTASRISRSSSTFRPRSGSRALQSAGARRRPIASRRRTSISTGGCAKPIGRSRTKSPNAASLVDATTDIEAIAQRVWSVVASRFVELREAQTLETNSA